MKNPTKNTNAAQNSALENLEQMLAKTCFCKLKEFCEDKNGSECMRHQNIYSEFMQQKNSHQKQ